MPIETDNSNIDFGWRFTPTQEGQEATSYALRLHKTPEYGWTISFLDNENQPVLSLPVDFLREVSEHVSTCTGQLAKLVRNSPGGRTVSTISLPSIGGKPKPKPVTGPGAVRPQAPTHTTVLPNGKKIQVVPDDAEGEFEAEDGVFIPSGHDPSQVDLNDDDPIFQSFSAAEPKKTVVAKPTETVDAAQILEERAKAAANPNKRSGLKPNGIQRRHTDSE